MAKDRLSGKLAVILHADVAGSTRLVQQDEQLAHQRIQDAFQRFSDTIGKYHGRVKEMRGDALLAEFERASDAVSASLAFQAEQIEHIVTLNDTIRPTIRVGIAMGEVIIADNTVTGAGVVLAQRVEQLAEPGGVCVTAAIHEALPQRMPFDLNSLGEQDVKGFDEQVRVYTVGLSPDAVLPKPEALLQTEAEVLKLPDKPSIAVLPFLNMSGDLEQEYFSDGITEDIITELSRFHEIFVIARNSSFTFKGKSVDVSEVASKLGIQFVVEGSVRKAVDRVRITAQLIDATTGSHIWADRFDRLLEDIFVVQDEVVAAIVSTLPSQIRQANLARPNRQLTDIRAYDLVLHASQTLSTLAGVESAITLLTQALDIDPKYALAHALLANALTLLSDYQLILKTDATEIKIMNHARRAIVLDPGDHRVYSSLSDACLFVEADLVESRIHAERALDLNPNSTGTVAWMGYIHNCYGETELAKELCTRAIRLDPLANAWVKFLQGVIYFDAGEIDLAIGMFLASDWDEKWPHLMAAYALSGQIDRAREIAMRTRKDWSDINPEDLDERIQKIMCDGWYTHGNHDGSFINGLRLAGLIA